MPMFFAAADGVLSPVRKRTHLPLAVRTDEGASVTLADGRARTRPAHTYRLQATAVAQGVSERGGGDSTSSNAKSRRERLNDDRSGRQSKVASTTAAAAAPTTATP